MKDQALEDQLEKSRREFYESEKRAEAILKQLDGLTYIAALSLLEVCRDKLSGFIVHTDYLDA